MSLVSRTVALFFGILLFLAGAAGADDVHVMTSGAYTAAFLHLAPEFEHSHHMKIVPVFGASMGNAPDSIPSRLERGEPADVVILAAAAVDDLIQHGKVIAGSRVDLVRSSIGMVVRAGAAKPDISTLDALKRTLLNARSIAYSDSASGVYLSQDLFHRLGIADQIRAKCQRIASEPVGAVVARGGAEIGFQQISELLPVKGIDYVGPLPPGAQRVTVFSAAIATGARNPDAGRELIQFLASPANAQAITATGLEVVTASH